jgi:hypothetical protein
MVVPEDVVGPQALPVRLSICGMHWAHTFPPLRTQLTVYKFQIWRTPSGSLRRIMLRRRRRHIRMDLPQIWE